MSDIAIQPKGNERLLKAVERLENIFQNKDLSGVSAKVQMPDQISMELSESLQQEMAQLRTENQKLKQNQEDAKLRLDQMIARYSDEMAISYQGKA